MSTSTEAFADRVFAAALGAIEIYSIHMGNELGFYRTLQARGPLTPAELASTTDVGERYAREWLEQQAAYSILDVDQSGETDVFTLPDDHAAVLVDELNGFYLVPLARMLSTSGEKMNLLLEAYRTGRGVSWEQFGKAMRESQADMNRPFFTNDLGGVISELGNVHELMSRPGARVADVGCGAGWSTIALARAYPEATFVGFDIDLPSIEMARENAEKENLGSRITFSSRDLTTVDDSFDVAFAFECIHDMSQPVPVLSAMRRLVGDDGLAVIMDEAVSDAFTGEADDVERLMYGFSLLVCLPDGLSHQPSVGTGTVMRPSTLEEFGRQSGFQGFRALDEAGFFRFYELSP